MKPALDVGAPVKPALDVEPTYEFVKGEGWVIQRCEVLTFTNAYGKIRFERRAPEIGERFFWWESDDSLEELRVQVGSYVSKYSGGTCESPINSPTVVIKVFDD